MKVVILAGGLGSRISEESHLIPKPMIEIGGLPLLWHVMKLYSAFHYNEFIICLGYKGTVIKDYFLNFFTRGSDLTVDLSRNGDFTIHRPQRENWKVTLVDTGLNTMTGGRIARVKSYLDSGRFMLTYGDGLGNIDINQLVACHEKSGKIATVTAVEPPGRFGAMSIDSQGTVTHFEEKGRNPQALINAGFFVLEPKVFDFIQDSDNCSWEAKPMEHLAAQSQLNAFCHKGFWHPMDTLRDKKYLEGLWDSGEAPWRSHLR